MRVAQMMFVPVLKPEFVEVTEFSEKTDRGENGWGSTGEIIELRKKTETVCIKATSHSCSVSVSSSLALMIFNWSSTFDKIQSMPQPLMNGEF